MPSAKRASHQLGVALLVVAIALCATAVVYASLSTLSSEPGKAVGKGVTVARLLDITVQRVGSRYTGCIHFYQWGRARLPIDLLYFVSRDGALHAVAKVYEVEAPEGPGVGEACFVVVSGELRRGVSYSVRAGSPTAGFTALMGAAIPSFQPHKTYKVYLVYIPSVHSHYVAKPDVLNKSLALLGEVHVVSSTDELERVVKRADPLTVIVNLHGEVVPAPRWVWEGAGCWDRTIGRWVGGVPLWLSWYSMIREAVAERGAIWVNVGGWPFYYVGNESSAKSYEEDACVKGFYQIAVCECAGCKWSSWRGYHGYDYMISGSFRCHPVGERVGECYLGVNRTTLFTRTKLMDRLAEVVRELRGLEAPRVHVHDVARDRPCWFRAGFEPSRVYYVASVDGTTWYGAYALKLGKGWLLHVGFGATITEEERAAIVLAMLLDVTAWRG